MRRRLLLILATLAALMIVTVATLPYWLGAVVAQVGRARGVKFAGYERIGYRRFAVHDVEVRYGPVRVTATRAEADTPMVWFWHRLAKHPNVVVADQWTVEVIRAESLPVGSGSPSSGPNTTTNAKSTNVATSPNTKKGGWVPLRGTLQRVAAGLARWLPQAKIGAGAVRWPGGGLSLSSAVWLERELVVEKLVYGPVSVNARLAFPAGADVLRLGLTAVDGTNSAKLENHAESVAGDVSWWDQRATISARFADAGWIPQAAAVQADDWNLPGARLKVGDLYSAVRGHARLDWSENQVVADVAFDGVPQPEKKAVPPLDVKVRGHGDAQAMTIESLNATLPGVSAQLSEPVTVERSGKFREGSARFAVQVDLAKQPWFSARGSGTGEARLVSGAAQSPVVEFHVEARDVSASDVSLSAVTADGRFEWPRVSVSSGTIVGGDGERLAWHGGWDFRAKSILDGAVEGQVRRSSLSRWLPAQPGFDVVSIKAVVSGAVPDVGHGGHVEAKGMKVPGLQPFALTFDWRGQGLALETFDIEAAAGTTKVSAAGSGDRTSVHLKNFELIQAETSRLRLKEPASIRWQPAVQLEAVHLAGPEGSIDVAGTWGPNGKVDFTARNIASTWFTEIAALSGPAWRCTSLTLGGAWAGGPMTFSLNGSVDVDLGDGHVGVIQAAAKGDKEGVLVETLRASEKDAAVFEATGRLPMVFRPGGTPLVRIDPDGAIAVDATAAPHATFWQQFATATGFELKDPEASLHFKGTWLRPVGGLQLKATRIAVDPERFKRPIPTLEKLDVQLSGDREGIRLETFSVSVEGQAVRAQGRLPVPDGRWTGLFKQPFATAQQDADVHLEVPDAEVAVFTRFMPAYVASKGRMQLDVTYKGGALDGVLRLRDAASLPLGPLGVLQEINADVQMKGRKLEIRSVGAKSGGQPIAITGTIELPADGTPRFDLAFRGENLPFVRQAGLLLRGDLDLKLQSLAGGGPRISGSVRLRDSLFLSDVRSFLPQGGTTAVRRPPYFALETPPLSAWGLAVDVTGARFLRLRTPVFTGVASVRSRLTGTLGEPRIIGEVTLDEGHVSMPFASFEIKQGAVRLTEANPFEPTVFVRGTGRRFGYDLTMEIDGAATSPSIILSSSPPLDSEQVLQMVMTGAPPSNDISYSATQRATRIGTFLGQALLGSLGVDAANADRLSISSGEKISRQGKETYDVEYKLTDRLTATGEYNEFDEQYAGLKWRMFPRKRESEGSAHATK